MTNLDHQHSIANVVHTNGMSSHDHSKWLNEAADPYMSPMWVNPYAGAGTHFRVNTDYRTYLYGTSIPFDVHLPDGSDPFITEQAQRGPFSEEALDMSTRGYFEVSIIEIETGAALFDERVVAENERNAERKVLRRVDAGKDLDELHIIVRKLGDVPAKRSVQKVEVVAGRLTGKGS
jgi:hypothetical protein